jgi:hypothetical protein
MNVRFMCFVLIPFIIILMAGCQKHQHHYYGQKRHEVRQSLHIPIHVRQSHDHDESKQLNFKADTNIEVPNIINTPSNHEEDDGCQ